MSPTYITDAARIQAFFRRFPQALNAQGPATVSYPKGVGTRRDRELLVRFLELGRPSSKVRRQVIEPIADCSPPGSPCGQGACPTCGPRIIQREAFNAVKAFCAAAMSKTGSFPLPDQTSYITLRGPKKLLDASDISRAAEQLKAELREFRRQQLQETSWRMYLEMGLSGCLHMHGLIHHPTLSRDQLLAILGRVFRGVDCKWKPWRSEKPLLLNFLGVFEYAAKFAPYGLKSVNDPNAKTANHFGRALLALQRISPEYPYVGRRFSINLSAEPWRWVDYELRNHATGEVVIDAEIRRLARAWRNGGASLDPV